MRAPDVALIRARARAPLRDLQVLHLSNAGIECFRHLEASCHALCSLYADENRLRNLEGLLSLRRLWRLDLNGNMLCSIHAGERLLSPLASFPAFGFLHLERNQLRFQDIACLRDVHIMDLRVLEGNPALLRTSSSEIEYRMKIVALLPNVWILDGHYVATTERERALDECDAFVQSLLDEVSTGDDGDMCDKFGSTAKLWSGVVAEDAVSCELNENVAHLIEHINTRRVRNAEAEDRRRLRTVISLHNAECVMHNTHCKFAPSKFSPSARAMPRIPLEELLAVSRTTRIEVAATLAAYLEFGFYRELLVEALVIQLLDCENVSAEELASLPPYAMAALLCIMRHHALGEDAKHSSEQDLDHKVWMSMPPLFTTLLGYDKDIKLKGMESFAARCAFVVGLLSRAASFPDNVQDLRSKRRETADAHTLKSATQLLQLVQVAQSSVTRSSIGSVAEDEVAGALGGTESIFIATSWVDAIRVADAESTKRTTRMPWKVKCPGREYPRPWESSATVTPSSASQPLSVLNARTTDNSQPKRKPRTGEWIEIQSKQFLKIRQLSEDGTHVVAYSLTETSTSIPILVSHLSRISSSLWRLDESASKQLRIGAELARSRSSLEPASNLGKLHRESEGFHRHGAARSQGFPNHFVTSTDLREMERATSDNQQAPSLHLGSSEQLTRPVALFASNDTIDANFVLAPPQLVSAQNYCAVRTFRELGQTPAGLWSPIKHSSCAVVMPTTATALISQDGMMKSAESGRKPLTVVKAAREQEKQLEVKADDDWALLQREMESVLRMKPRQSTLNTPATPEQRSVRPHDDVLHFLTSVPPPVLDADSSTNATGCRDPSEDSELLIGRFDTGFSRDASMSVPVNVQIALRTPSRQPSKQAKARGAVGSVSWHHVSTKSQLLVSSNSVPMLGRYPQEQPLPSASRVQPQQQQQQPRKLQQQEASSPIGTSTPEGLPRPLSAGRTIPQCHVVLPALAQSRQVQQTDSI